MTTNELVMLPIEELRRRHDARALNMSVLAALSESIEDIGLVNPIRVRRSGETYEVIAGSHRFAACDALGLTEIACFIVDDDDLHAELAMIDENLMRAELSPVDRAKQTARRKAIYEELHPETKREATLMQGHNLPSRQLGETEKSDRFTTETARATGKSERVVQRDAERGERVSDEAANAIRGTKLDTGTYLDKIKRVEPEKQAETVRRDLSDDTPRGGIAARYSAPAKPQADPAQSYVRFIKLVDELEAIPVSALIDGAGRQRSVLGQRASGLADRMSEIMERLD